MKNIAIIACGQNTADHCREQLAKIIGSEANLQSFCTAMRTHKQVDADLIVFTSQIAFDGGQDFLPPHTPFIIAQRAINYNEIEKLLAVPAGTDVLLVNDHIDTAENVIVLLQTMGIDHLNYYAYAPGMPRTHETNIAVTPGEAQFVPKEIQTIIDIGTRQLDITALVQILEHFHALSEYGNLLSAYYIHDIIKLTKLSFQYKNKAIRLKDELARLESTIRKTPGQHARAAYHFEDIIGNAPALRHTIALAQKFAASESTILIESESGTGKELLAQSIHNASPRAKGPFVAVNFAAVTESLMDSELFGYVEGAFTGAARHGAVGLFEHANHGTIFLDEIGDVPLALQAKLLRVLQEKEIRRVGGVIPIHIDVRVIAATNQDLAALVRQGKFRRDLYYRLSVLPLALPPLANRGTDILLLAKHILRQLDSRMDDLQASIWFSHIKDCLLQYAWPGNIRELQNAVEYLHSVCGHRCPECSDLPPNLQRRSAVHAASPLPARPLGERIRDEIRRANAAGETIGRRSLAARLSAPESRIRAELKALEKEGAIRLTRGRGGIRMNAT